MRKSIVRIVLFFLFLLPYYRCEAKSKPKRDAIYLADPTIFYYHGSYYLYGTEQNPENGFPVLVSKNFKEWEEPSKLQKKRLRTFER